MELKKVELLYVHQHKGIDVHDTVTLTAEEWKMILDAVETQIDAANEDAENNRWVALVCKIDI